jgi:hypothetical protein
VKPSRVLLVLAFVLAAAGSFFATTLQQRVFAARNSSGVYSLPSGNPVVGGTTITSSWANNTLSDLGTEVTNSLDRAGRGGMTGPLQLSNGTVSAPAVTFTSEPSSGLYRAGSGDVRVSVSSTDVAKYQSTGATFLRGATVTQATANTVAFTSTGNGTGDGVQGFGGATSANGVYGSGGAPNGIGVAGAGTGTGTGVYGAGGTTGGGGMSGQGGNLGTGAQAGPGVTGTGGNGSASNSPGGVGVKGFGGTGNGAGAGGIGVTGAGGGTAAGGYFANGTAATGATRQDAVGLANGDLSLDGVANINSTVASKNRLTPSNIPKAWGYLAPNGAGSVTVSAGFNIASAAISGANVQVTLAQAMSSSTYVVTCTLPGGANQCGYVTTGSATFTLLGANSAGVAINFSTSTIPLAFVVYGNQ